MQDILCIVHRVYACWHVIACALDMVIFSFQYIILGTSDGAVRMLDHAGNVLKDRVYHLVIACLIVHLLIILSSIVTASYT